MDIGLLLDADGSGADIAIVGGDIATDATLQSAVIASLLSNRVADPDDVLPDGIDPGGWWGDAYRPPLPDGSAMLTGSKLWLRRRSLATQATALQIAEDCEQALAWMISTGVAQDVVATASWASATAVNITVAISQIGQGGRAVLRQFNFVWSQSLGTLTVA